MRNRASSPDVPLLPGKQRNAEYPARIASVNTSFSNPPIDDLQLLPRIPEEIANALRRQNGFIAESGRVPHISILRCGVIFRAL
jgi:hypothetical protein